MSVVVAQPNPHVTAVSAPLSAASSRNSDALENKLSKEAGIDFAKFRCSPSAVANLCECAPQSTCFQTAESNFLGLGTTMLPSTVSAILVVIGWFVVHKAQSNRERRKQIREYVVDLCDDLAELETLALGYHTTPREEAKEQEIISKLGRLEKACSTLPRFLESQKFFKAVQPVKLTMDGRRMQVLRKAMTLNHFGDEHTGALGRQDEYILNLELAAVEMREALEGVRIDALD